MITLRILLSPGRRGRVVDASGRSVPQPVPAPVIGAAEPLRIILLDPATLDPADPYGFDVASALRLTISGDWDPATIPVYATNALSRVAVGTYDLADPSGTRTAEALALLGGLAECLCAWELTAYGGDPATEADWAHPLSVVQFDAPLRQRADSLGGDPTAAPAVDLRGPAGRAATVAVGATTTLPAGSSATVANVGTESAAILSFGIPQGPAGSIVFEPRTNPPEALVYAAAGFVTPLADTIASISLAAYPALRAFTSNPSAPVGHVAAVRIINDTAADVVFNRVSLPAGNVYVFLGIKLSSTGVFVPLSSQLQ